MATAVTNGIYVRAMPSYEPELSDPAAGRFVFKYVIIIRNLGSVPVKLMRRRWVIKDSLAAPRVVEGPGVVGETPEIQPRGHYVYNSRCDLRSGAGCMEGSYQMLRLHDGQTFTVRIPRFDLLYPWAAN
ncbi:MAG: Co2+/Mg2+ efflux protein ApaG [Flavobacteriales bacterium]|nr:Co2+/Mg2+ efflux protein ApaG [Flavobacteriales bacterium]